MQGKTVIIGIDTGVNTGICVWRKDERKIHVLESTKIHAALAIVSQWNQQHPGKVFVRVEDARLRKWIPRQANEVRERGRREGAGSVKRDAKVWEDFLTDLKIPFELVAPKNNKTKVTAEYFNKLTGYKGKTNQHNRDAAMLVIGF